MATSNRTSMVDSPLDSNPVDEYALIDRFQRGERDVFNELIIRYQGKIYSLVYKHVPNPEIAKDLCQEIFIKAYQALPRFKGESAFYSWIYRIAINRCIDFIRQQNRKRTVSFDELSPTICDNNLIFNDSAPRPPEQAESSELGQIIGKAVSQLPPGQQRVFNLRYHEGLQLKEIAARLDRSEGTIKAHLHHAHRRLQTLLRPYLQNEPFEWAINA